MFRTRSFIAGALALGTVALTPMAASADPVITGPTALEIEIGAAAWIGGTGCTSPDSQPTYGGVYIRLPDYPGYENWTRATEVPADNGTFGWMGETNQFPAGQIDFMFYCSTASMPPAYDAQTPGLLWASAPYSRTFVAPAAPNALTASARSTATARTTETPARTAGAPVSSGSAPAFTVDANALPAFDMMGITGTRAAALKATVDRQAPAIARIRNLTRAILGREATATHVRTMSTLARAGASDRVLSHAIAAQGGYRAPRGTNRAVAIGRAVIKAKAPAYVAAHEDENYVVAANLVLTGSLPSPRRTAELVNQLAQPMPRVQVVEDIALTVHDAAWYATH